MKKKVALVLVMVMLANMIAWADDSDTASDEDVGVVLAVIGAGVLIGLLCWGIGALIDLAEADTPDDGIRLTSMESEPSIPNTEFTSFLNLLRHVEIGQTQDNKIYAGLHFQF